MGIGGHTEYTIFYFDVPSPHLIPAMERFAEFFISPLFKSDCVERELKAVHSEFVDSKNADYHRRGSVQSATAKPNHPFAKFGWSHFIARSCHNLRLLVLTSGNCYEIGVIWNL